MSFEVFLCRFSGSLLSTFTGVLGFLSALFPRRGVGVLGLGWVWWGGSLETLIGVLGFLVGAWGSFCGRDEIGFGCFFCSLGAWGSLEGVLGFWLWIYFLGCLSAFPASFEGIDCLRVGFFDISLDCTFAFSASSFSLTCSCTFSFYSSLTSFP